MLGANRYPVVEREPAIDDDRCSGDVTRKAIAQQSDRHIRDVFRRSGARPSGIILANDAMLASKPPPGIAPGAMALTRMPSAPSARASSFTTMVWPALVAL